MHWSGVQHWTPHNRGPFPQGVHSFRQPAAIGNAVRVRKCQDVSPGETCPQVAGGPRAQSGVATSEADSFVCADYNLDFRLGGRLHDNDLEAVLKVLLS